MKLRNLEIAWMHYQIPYKESDAEDKLEMYHAPQLLNHHVLPHQQPEKERIARPVDQEDKFNAA